MPYRNVTIFLTAKYVFTKASFYGENKLCFIKDKNLDNLSLESFKEVILLDRFKE